jgi:hypothetical protein
LPNVFQNGSSSIKKAAPQKELEPEPFSKEPEPCQTGPKMMTFSGEEKKIVDSQIPQV